MAATNTEAGASIVTPRPPRCGLALPARQSALASSPPVSPSCHCLISANAAIAEASRQLEARIERIEKELAELQSALGGRPATPWYREIVGMFAGDEAFGEIIRPGRLIRQGKLKGWLVVPVLLDTDHLSVLEWEEQPACRSAESGPPNWKLDLSRMASN